MACEQHRQDEDIVLGPDFKAAADQELFCVDLSVQLPFLDEEAADEKTAEDEEDIDARPSEEGEAQFGEGVLKPRQERVVVHHHEDGEAADKVEFYLTLRGGGEAIFLRHSTSVEGATDRLNATFG